MVIETDGLIERKPIEALWQVYIIDTATGTVVLSGVAVAKSVSEAMKNLDVQTKLTKSSKVKVFAREVGYPISESVVIKFLVTIG